MVKINLNADLASVYARLSGRGGVKEICLHGISKIRSCGDCERVSVQLLMKAGEAHVEERRVRTSEAIGSTPITSSKYRS